jgi:hypothetical protein
MILLLGVIIDLIDTMAFDFACFRRFDELLQGRATS